MTQRTSDLEWSDPDRGMSHYGPHVPVFVANYENGEDAVVCPECGAVATNADLDEWR